MKTTDLIPLILLELKDCDKYGFELTKSIETKSAGKIIIKQPTLYTILKKLEKSKFISSYWKDSDIGGKRHYYKITENGLKQTSTLPSYNDLLAVACDETTEEKLDEVHEEIVSTDTDTNEFSIFDHLKTNENNNSVVELKEEIVPSVEVFNDENIDVSTEFEINKSNIEMMKSEEINTEEKFAENIEASKFVENISTEPPKEIVVTSTPIVKPNIEKIIKNYNNNYGDVEYVDFIDLKKDENYIYSKKTIKKLTSRILLSCTYLLAIILLCSLFIPNSAKGSIYYISLIISLSFLIFIPTLYAAKYQKIKNKLLNKKLNINLKIIFILYFVFELIIISSCIIANIFILNNSFIEIFKISNINNLYIPLIFSTTLIFDLIVTKIIFKNK